jgi:transposase
MSSEEKAIEQLLTEFEVSAKPEAAPPQLTGEAEKVEPLPDLSDIPALFNQRLPRWRNQREKYIHRLVALMTAEGRSPHEIAEILGLHYITVLNLQKQPYVRDLVLREMHRAGRGKIQEMLEVQVIPSIEKIVKLRDTAAKPEVQLKAANDILNRVFGMPNQPITTRREDTEDLSKLSDAEIDARIAKLKQRTN